MHAVLIFMGWVWRCCVTVYIVASEYGLDVTYASSVDVRDFLCVLWLHFKKREGCMSIRGPGLRCLREFDGVSY